jgi:hypothetical protein
MGTTVDLHKSLPAYLIRGAMKEDVIKYLAAADTSPISRRNLYRAWCAATFTKCRREDLYRVAPRRKREDQIPLIADAFAVETAPRGKKAR